MDAKLQRLIQRRGWDLAASDYEKSWSRQLQPSTDKLLAFADVKPGESVIETASGTGLITLVVAEQARNGRVLATDISKKMLFQLRMRQSTRKEFKPHHFGILKTKVAQLYTVKREREVAEGVGKRDSREIKFKERAASIYL